MSNLYEELGVPTDASQEQIRKAYKKRALQTHPDRLPNATAAEKAASEEKFRKVNNAYEVLSDPKKRSEYDIHGVWPPPEVEPEPSPYMPSGSRHSSSYRRHSSRTQPFPDPFFAHHHAHRHHAYSSFQFTDPFTLFDSIFEDLNPFRGHSTRQAPSPFSMDPFERMNRFHAEIDALMHDIDRDPFGMSGFPSFGRHSALPSFPAIDRSPFDTSHGHWVSESFMTSTVNGVTQTISKRIDSEGNEHITRTLPDGRKIQTINGVEQGTAGQLPYNDYDTSKARPLPEPSGHRYLPPVATRSQTVLETPSPREYPTSPPPYTSQPTAYQLQPQPAIRPPDEHRRSRRSSEKYYANHHHSSSSNHSFQHVPTTPTEPHRKKRWWQ
ncbi:hypothetical protein D9613_006894 [Agrocybe pediades]|uniref:J domain-containing protein n=1 Tax=Agrocybe pediades TaxID=84607 RepID=A0A8H4QGW5_9AGAR|nr:hypothetical protein D9613_006894 [Agrocybe pediades]